MRKLTIILLLLSLLAGCSKQHEVSDKMLVVSVVPLKYVVENIVGDDFDIEVVVPTGASPETYEPTPAQMENIESAKMIDIIYNTAHKSFLVEYGSAALGIVGCLDKAVSGETNVMTLLDGKTGAEQAINNYIAETKASLLGYK
jgi:hypothetical protein